MKQIKGTNYFITEEGHFYKGERRMYPDRTNFGHLCIRITLNGKRVRKYIHRLVAENFIPNPENKSKVNHWDGNPSNNHVSNLVWATHAENIAHAYQILKKSWGELRSDSKLSNEQVKFIRNNYIPFDKEFGQTAMAKKFGVCQQTVSRIIKRGSWKNL